MRMSKGVVISCVAHVLVEQEIWCSSGIILGDINLSANAVVTAGAGLLGRVWRSVRTCAVEIGTPTAPLSVR